MVDWPQMPTLAEAVDRLSDESCCKSGDVGRDVLSENVRALLFAVLLGVRVRWLR